MINVENLSKSFQGSLILKDISFQVNSGEIICIIGPSGAGKSTLLRCLNFLEIPNHGCIQIDDCRITEKEYRNKQKISQLRKKSAMIFQEFHLFLNKNVLENVMLPLISTKKKSVMEAEKIALKCLGAVGMKDYLKQYPQTLSGGQKQRVAIARSLAIEPQILLFDEPTSALDPLWTTEVLRIIENLAQQDFTILIVTHEISFAERIADRIFFMQNGQIIQQAENLQHLSQHPQIQQFLNHMQQGNYEII